MRLGDDVGGDEEVVEHQVGRTAWLAPMPPDLPGGEKHILRARLGEKSVDPAGVSQVRFVGRTPTMSAITVGAKPFQQRAPMGRRAAGDEDVGVQVHGATRGAFRRRRPTPHAERLEAAGYLRSR